MTDWDASADLMAKLRASIRPVQTDEPLRQVLMHDFPRDCSNLPISGGWGYTQVDAVVFVRELFPMPVDFVPLEYHIAQKIIYEELIIFQPNDHRFSGIDLRRTNQEMIADGARRYDVLDLSIKCWSDWHWNQLKQEWEENDLGMRRGFDREAHAAKRDASQVKYERQFLFDITEVFDRGQRP
jgi:hypothetical protein